MAEKTCALTINGAYLGLIDGFERTVELEPADKIFCEIAPQEDFLPIRFCLDEAFLLAPPPQVTLYYAENFVVVHCSDFVRADQSLKVLSQTRFRGALLTLTRQGNVILNLETEHGFFPIPLPDAFEECAFQEINGGFLLRGENAFALISREGKTLLLSEGNVLSADKTLTAEIPFHDSLAHTALCEWRGGELVSCTIRTTLQPTEQTLALALFESALIGADCSPFLGETLSDKASSLKEYLGDYRSVVLTEERDKVGLVYERRERVFDVRYFRVVTENGKIANIKPL